MEHQAFQTIAFAFNAGIFSILLSHVVRLPSIIFFLIAGVLLGPGFVGIINPASLGNGFPVMIEAAVAIIVFEGSMNLNLKQLFKTSKIIRNMVSIGALISALLTTLLAHYLIGLDWFIALIFGCIMVITGPTVITPILKRVPLKEPLGSILHWESILLEPIGVTIGLLVLELVLVADATVTHSAIQFLLIIITGAGVGAGFTFILGQWLKRWPPNQAGVQNLIVLGSALLIFELANLIIPHAGLAAVVAGGLIFGKSKIPALREIMEFKETITQMLISFIFILLAAKLDIQLIFSGGIGTLLFLILVLFVVRPLTIFISTAGSELNTKSKLFLSLMAPRGIVSASLISLIAILLQKEGMDQGKQMEVLAFQLIGVTVILHGTWAPLIAWILGVKQKEKQGYLIIGANALARNVAKALNAREIKTILVDRDGFEIQNCFNEGLTAVKGDALDQRFLNDLELHDIGRMIAMTPNDEINTLACQLGHRLFEKGKCYQLRTRPKKEENSEEIMEEAGGVLFGELSMHLNYLLAEIHRNRYEFIETESPLPEGFMPLFAINSDKSLKSFDSKDDIKDGTQIFGLGVVEN